MIKLHILVVGALKKGPLFELYRDFEKRSGWPVFLCECRDDGKLVEKIRSDWPLWVMDERGNSVKSVVFARDLQHVIDEGHKDIQFVIGGADGLPEGVRKSADKLMSFGKQTWPHMMARVMLMEQLYRAQQILKGHPYHRE